jgi:hypothetical protein
MNPENTGLMTMFKILRSVSVAIAVLILMACSGITPIKPSPTIKTYEPVWINAYWTGGQTGAPLITTVGPGSFTGTYCPYTSLILENHSSRYQSVFSNSRNVLVFKNVCNQTSDLLVCQVGGNVSEFPLCNNDATTTPLSRLASVNMGPNNSGLQSTTWRETGLELDLNIFYCGIGDTFTLGSIAGAASTDCIQAPK